MKRAEGEPLRERPLKPREGLRLAGAAERSGEARALLLCVGGGGACFGAGRSALRIETLPPSELLLLLLLLRCRAEREGGWRTGAGLRLIGGEWDLEGTELTAPGCFCKGEMDLDEARLTGPGEAARCERCWCASAAVDASTARCTARMDAGDTAPDASSCKFSRACRQVGQAV